MATMVTIKLLFFAKARELVNKAEENLNICACKSGSDMIQLILNTYPDLSVIGKSFILAHNEEYITDSEELIHFKDGDEIAVIPPLSGG